ncbi:hypothetical protein SISNIDRAFT_484114 [Sistotremastrum niveocremeum HHB9708]|uniref:Uncharacterized protein n=1 Tax=Sistotremastrum niveocremeum HHB9708 TaxID=1314777 RepID=A0A164WPY1_9AGAM|nr:hypothetical protein SISNIDRAFT_484114 [Sistotremastrum niveocremeum HHB9708]
MTTQRRGFKFDDDERVVLDEQEQDQVLSSVSQSLNSSTKLNTRLLLSLLLLSITLQVILKPPFYSLSLFLHTPAIHRLIVHPNPPLIDPRIPELLSFLIPVVVWFRGGNGGGSQEVWIACETVVVLGFEGVCLRWMREGEEEVRKLEGLKYNLRGA